MNTPDELNSRFQNEGIQFETGHGGLTKCLVKNDMASAEIYLHGAHVTHFQPHGADPFLWMSSQAVYDSQKAIRGGIPVCWPWFGQHATEPDFPQHGFARISDWKVRAVFHDDDRTDLLLGLTSNETSQKYLNGSFDARYRISVGQSLTIEMSVTNTGELDLEGIGCALHTYFSIMGIENVSLDGFVGKKYLDQLTGAYAVEDRPVRFSEEVDRVYFNTTDDIRLKDGTHREFVIQSQGSKSTVVWNPWIDKSKRMPDFPDDGFQTMVCVESANAYQDVRTIGPGETHTISQSISQTISQ